MSKKCGINNFGFNCFINTTIQCLKSCSNLMNELKNNDENEKIILLNMKKFMDNRESNIKEEIKIDIEGTEKILDDKLFSYLKLYFNFKMLLTNLVSYDKKTFCPKDLFASCRQASVHICMEHLFDGSQNDMQEFLSFIIDTINESISFKKKIEVPNFEPQNVLEIIKKNSVKTYKTHFENNYSHLVKNLYFLVLTVIKCNSCEHNNLSYEPTNLLCLPIPNQSKVSIYDCLDHYFGRDTFDSKNKWKCDKCGNIELNYKESRLINAPPILIIVIKRFQYTTIGWKKQNQLVNFPDILDISAYVIGRNDNEYRYELKAIGNHSGNLGSGHYYAYCKEDGNWFNYNDEHISEIAPNTIFSNTAYTLFYEKI